MDDCIRKMTCQRPPYPDERQLYICGRVSYLDKEFYFYEYPSNIVTSSRYTAWNFLPKALFEQMQRIANFYFIMVMIVQLLIDTPVSPITTIAPIVFVISLSVIKQGIEDIMRHRADNEVNQREVEVLRDGQFVKVPSSDLIVGDVIKCRSGQPFPCDLVMLRSVEDSGECAVTTANLDGETSLKTHFSIEETQRIDLEADHETCVKIVCTQPVQDLYTFHGHMEVFRPNKPSVSMALSAKNMLLRGAVLKNTNWVIGVAVYTGPDTKLSLNSLGKRAKYSKVELRLNYFLIAYFSILFVESVICLICLYMFLWTRIEYTNAWYLQPVVSNTTGWQVTQSLFGFIVLYNYLVPISLYVTIELQKFFGSFNFRMDIEMYDGIGDYRAKVNTSDLNEELGQIAYLFSDKTGTLTENDMQFRRCSINGLRYIDVEGDLCKMCLEENGMDEVLLWPYEEVVTDFLVFMCVCHTVRVDRTGGTETDKKEQTNGYIGPLADKKMISSDGLDYDYQASSPDEKAFIEASRRYGIIYHGQLDGFHCVSAKDSSNMMKFKVREVFEFDSDRKRMSVIVTYPDGSNRLLCKGAEANMISQANNAKGVSSDTIMLHLTEYAEHGLRTLVFGYRMMTEAEVVNVLEEATKCKKSLTDSEKLLAQLYEKVESDLMLVGCTGIEDRLQDGVKETLEDLRAAGIKVWVLTGDKEETAVNISYSAGHFATTMQEMRLTKLKTSTEAQRALLNQLERMETASSFLPDAAYCLIVDGAALKYLLEPELEQDFVDLCKQVSTVLCCRMTPLQKAEIVGLIKRNVKPEPVTAAIGDGGNDVSMIQEAHVGIGIFGKEGRQAVRAADYALGKFRFLRRAVLVHGQYFYSRITNLIQYFFYKNLVFITPQFYFSFVNLYSAYAIYYFVILMIYNVTFTTLPVLVYGVIEQNFEIVQLLSKPYLYKINRDNAELRLKNFVRWNAFGVWHSLVIFLGVYVIWLTCGSVLDSSGQASPVEMFGRTVFDLVWIIVSAKLYLITRYFNMAVFISFLIVLVGNVVLFLALSVAMVDDFYYMMINLYSQPAYWLQLLLLSVIALTPDVIYKIFVDQRFLRILHMPGVKRTPPKRRVSYVPSKQKESHVDIPFERDDGGFASFRSKEQLTTPAHDNPSFN